MYKKKIFPHIFILNLILPTLRNSFNINISSKIYCTFLLCGRCVSFRIFSLHFRDASLCIFSLHFRDASFCIFSLHFRHASFCIFSLYFRDVSFPIFSLYFRPTFRIALTKVLLSYQLRHLIRCTIGFI